MDFRVWQQHVHFQSCRDAPVDGIDFDFFSLWQDKRYARGIIYDIVECQTPPHTGPPKSQLEKHNAPQCCQYDPLLIHKQFLTPIPQHAWKEYLPPNPSHPPSSTTFRTPRHFHEMSQKTEPGRTSKDGFRAWKAAILLGLRVLVPAIGLFVGCRWDWDDGSRE